MGDVQLPTYPQVWPCTTDNTANVWFKNESRENHTLRVFWDGRGVYKLEPGELSSVRRVEAGVQHTLVWKIAGTKTVVCEKATHTLAACDQVTYACEG